MRKVLSLAAIAAMALATYAEAAQRRRFAVAIRGCDQATVAAVYFWKAKPGKLEEYNRYIREVAEPIDAAAQRRGAFLTVLTLRSHKQDSSWTHMRVFLLKDETQLLKLAAELDAAGERLEPDAAKRKAREEYAGTLRDAAGQEVVELLR